MRAPLWLLPGIFYRHRKDIHALDETVLSEPKTRVAFGRRAYGFCGTVEGSGFSWTWPVTASFRDT